MNPLNAYLAQSVMADRYALAEARRRTREERPARKARRFDSVTIRRVTPDDWRAVERLAQLEGRPAPRGEALLAEAQRRARGARPAREAVTYDSVTIRRVTPDDWPAVERLAQLEARAPLREEALLAEVGDEVLAVHSLHDGSTLADPFRPTAELVSLLKARARHASGPGATIVKPVRRAAARIAALYS